MERLVGSPKVLSWLMDAATLRREVEYHATEIEAYRRLLGPAGCGHADHVREWRDKLRFHRKMYATLRARQS